MRKSAMIECARMIYDLKDKITVIIPTFNNNSSINKLLEDLSNQYYVNGVTVIIVDSTSNKETLEILNKEYPNLNIKIIENVTEDDARNIGSKECLTENVVFIEPDVRLLSKWTLFNTVYWLDKKKVVTCKPLLYTQSVFTNLLFKIYRLIFKITSKVSPIINRSYFAIRYSEFTRIGKFTLDDKDEYSLKFLSNFTPRQIKLVKDDMKVDKRKVPSVSKKLSIS